MDDGNSVRYTHTHTHHRMNRSIRQFCQFEIAKYTTKQRERKKNVASREQSAREKTERESEVEVPVKSIFAKLRDENVEK